MGLTAEKLREDLDALAAREPQLAAALARVGYPDARIREPGFATMLRTIVGQQVSVAAAASMWKLPIHPHSSMTGLNHAVSIHFLASIDNGGYFEADLSVANKFRDELGSVPWQIGKDGCVRPLDKPGIGVEIDEKFLIAHPVIEGPGYV